MNESETKQLETLAQFYLQKSNPWERYQPLLEKYSADLQLDITSANNKSNKSKKNNLNNNYDPENLSHHFINNFQRIVLHEENHFAVVFKPPGILSQPDYTKNPSIIEYSKLYFKLVRNKPGNVFISSVNRLDRVAAGLMILAKTSKGAARLSQSFRERSVKKKYWVLINGTMMPKEGIISNKFIKQKNDRRNIFSEDGKDFSLFYKSLRQFENNISLLSIQIKTGYFHQIRSILGHAGHPILGDKKYGCTNDSLNDQRHIALVCRSLAFPHPIQAKQQNQMENQMVDICLDTAFPFFNDFFCNVFAS